MENLVYKLEGLEQEHNSLVSLISDNLESSMSSSIQFGELGFKPKAHSDTRQTDKPFVDIKFCETRSHPKAEVVNLMQEGEEEVFSNENDHV